MNPYLTEQLASQHAAEVRARSADSVRATRVAQARRAREATAHTGHRHAIRRRAGWALISLGLRLTYAAGKD